MNTQADPGRDHPAPTSSPDATPSADSSSPAPDALRSAIENLRSSFSPASTTPADPQSSIKHQKSNFLPPPLQIQDHIHPTDLLPPNARPFNPAGKKSRRATSAEKSIPDLPPGTSYRTLRLADVSARPVDWLWPNRIPIGKVTLLIGDPGTGKSLLALDLAARLTRGVPFPDQYKHDEVPADDKHRQGDKERVRQGDSLDDPSWISSLSPCLLASQSPCLTRVPIENPR